MSWGHFLFQRKELVRSDRFCSTEEKRKPEKWQVSEVGHVKIINDFHKGYAGEGSRA